MRDRLMELFRKVNYQNRPNGLTANLATQFNDYALGEIADALIAEGVVEVVRCKDCKNYDTRGCADGFGCCGLKATAEMDEHYCNFGKKRKGGKK